MADTQSVWLGMTPFELILAGGTVLGIGISLIQLLQTRQTNKHFARQNDLFLRQNEIIAGGAKPMLVNPVQSKSYLPPILMLIVSASVWAALLYEKGKWLDSLLFLVLLLLLTIFMVAWVTASIRKPNDNLPDQNSSEETLPEIPSLFARTPEELIGDFSPTGNVVFKNGAYEINENGRITTKRHFPPPVAFRLCAKTYLYELRFGYIEKEMILNWGGPSRTLSLNNEFRVGSGLDVPVKGPFDGRHVPNKGRIPIDRFVRIDVVATRKGLKVYVEGELRFEGDADLTNYNEPFTVSQWGLSVITVKSLLVGAPIS